MNYCILDNNKTIVNIIVCDNDKIAEEFNAVPSYEYAKIGDIYNPPNIDNLSMRVEEIESTYISEDTFANYVNEGVEATM